MDNKRMSLLIFCDVNSCGGGVYIYTLQLLQVCTQNNIDVYLISHEPKSEKEALFLEPLNKKFTGICLIPNNLKDKEIVRRIANYAEKIKPDWYVPNYREGAHGAMVPLKKIGVKNIFICHNDHSSQYRYAYRYQDVIDLFVSPSRKGESVLKETLQPVCTSRVSYIPHCVDNVIEQESKSECAAQALTLLYCGRVRIEQKRLDFFPAICRALTEKNIAYKLLIVGGGEETEIIKELFDVRDISQVVFYGQVDRLELNKFYAMADITILTSSYEGFCLGLAEAMGAGLPAVAFECGGVIDDYLKNGVNGYIVPFGDVDRFVEKLLDVKTHYVEFSESAKAEIRTNFSFQYFAKNYHDILGSKKEVPYKWPILRSHLIPQKDLSVSGVIEKVGKVFLNWK